jgi:hypothetical protein
MLRLLYLLLRQNVRRHSSGPVPGAPTPRQRSTVNALLAGAAAVTAATGAALIGAFACFGPDGLPLALAPARAATLQLQIGTIEYGPLVVFLEIPTETSADPRAVARITSVGSSFQPAFQVAPLPASIEVGNQDPIPHNTHVFDGRRTLFNVAVPLAGIRAHKVLGRPGIFEIRCDFHPWMRAWLFVPSGPHHAVVWTAGAASLHDIPPGTHRLHVWTPAHGDTVRTLSFASGEVKSLRLSGA